MRSLDGNREKGRSEKALGLDYSRHRAVYPIPRWAVTIWLSDSSSASTHEIGAELKTSMFRRMTSLVLSAIVTVILTGVAFFHHPTPGFFFWLAADSVLVAVRLLLVLAITQFSGDHTKTFLSKLPIADLFIVAGITWSCVLGFGTALCINSNDPGLGILGAFLAMGTVGGLTARNPSTPRITILQMVLIIAPIGVAAAISSTPIVAWIVILAPIYLFAMVSINRQLHEDYVALLASRIENRHLALHCPLTDLPNRTLFHARLCQAIDAAHATRALVFVLCLDLDGFKQVNDDLGHPEGDLLLQQVSARLLNLLGTAGTVARLGGDEFAILMPTGTPEAAQAIAAALIFDLDQPFVLTKGEVRVGVSIGIARGDGMTSDPLILLNQADAALYAAKKAGKGIYRWFGEGDNPMPEVALEHLAA